MTPEERKVSDLVEQWMPLVWKYTYQRSQQHPHIPQDMILSAAMEGMWRAAKLYVERPQYSVGTYARRAMMGQVHEAILRFYRWQRNDEAATRAIRYELSDDYDYGIEEYLEHLSPAEQRVARLYAEGKSVSEIAGELDITVDAVGFQRRRIRRKLEDALSFHRDIGGGE